MANKQTVIKFIPKEQINQVRAALPCKWAARGRKAHPNSGWKPYHTRYTHTPMWAATQATLYQAAGWPREKIYFHFQGFRNDKPVLRHAPNGGGYNG